MKSLILLLCLLFLIRPSWEISDKCVESSANLKEVEEDCSNQEYTTYTECVRRNRSKRHLDCEQAECDNCDENVESSSSCNDCNCNYCSYHECSSNCNQCCDSQPPPCASFHCCHKTCNTQCGSYDCRRRCKKTCQEKITTISSNSAASNVGVSSNTTVRSLHNITTVINLHNIINNTNIIDMPVQVNNTNINNITIQTPNIELPTQQIVFQPPERPAPIVSILPTPVLPTPSSPCCKIIEPRQCTPTTTFPFQKCFHIRRQHCGGLCTSNIMHAQPHQICDQESGMQASCQQQVTYIPQPQPRCFATSSWPYVNCRLQNYATSNCEGCYGGGYRDQRSCGNSCFDQGFDNSQFNRPGQYYQPSLGGFGNMGQTMDYNSMNLFGNPGAMMGVPSDNQYGIVKSTGLNTMEYMSNDKIDMVHEPIGRGYRSLEDFANSLEYEQQEVSSKEKNNDSDEQKGVIEDN